ncbi:zinc finger matrin-type protein 5 isoform X2 [Neoarius graeffei]|uniref:zinc finger matrin-type protein 5 isoform X2 n=1 Tax=Neoarius graeffei TaxID=443677 RepID=UPI00298C027D|nr:zinc finger matrin-type protein 5 isoform X2 [Neoarius graeffei]
MLNSLVTLLQSIFRISGAPLFKFILMDLKILSQEGFQDTLHNRKKHLNGVQHHRAKKAWFDSFRDAVAVLQDERAKQGCRKFLQTGQCVFGPSCRYSHMSEQDMKNLEQNIHEERQQAVDFSQEESSTNPSLEEWLSRREKRAALSSGSLSLLPYCLRWKSGSDELSKELVQCCFFWERCFKTGGKNSN